MLRFASLARRIAPLAAGAAVAAAAATTNYPLQCKESKKKLTVAELIALKGKRQIIVTTAFDEWTARAAEEAGVDMILAWGSCHEHSKYVIEAVRRGAPNTLIGSGINPGAYQSSENALKLAAEV